jgi:hypothetical protein
VAARAKCKQKMALRKTQPEGSACFGEPIGFPKLSLYISIRWSRPSTDQPNELFGALFRGFQAVKCTPQPLVERLKPIIVEN